MAVAKAGGDRACGRGWGVSLTWPGWMGAFSPHSIKGGVIPGQAEEANNSV